MKATTERTISGWLKRRKMMTNCWYKNSFCFWNLSVAIFLKKAGHPYIL